MMIALSSGQIQALLAFLRQSEDAERLADAEYTVDLFELEPPLSLQFELKTGGIDVLAAAELAYDEALDGWYIHERLEDANQIKRKLFRWPPLAEPEA